MHFHAEEVWTAIVGGYGLMFASYLVRTFPKPKNIYGMWFLGGIQFLLLNIEQGKNNVQAIQESKFVNEVGSKLDVENAKVINQVLKGTGSGAVSEEDLPKPEKKDT